MFAAACEADLLKTTRAPQTIGRRHLDPARIEIGLDDEARHAQRLQPPTVAASAPGRYCREMIEAIDRVTDRRIRGWT